MHGGPQFAKSRLTGCQSLASRHVHCLDLLHGHGSSGHIHAAAAAVLVVLAVPDQFSPHLRERMRVIGAPADGIRHGTGLRVGADEGDGNREDVLQNEVLELEAQGQLLLSSRWLL